MKNLMIAVFVLFVFNGYTQIVIPVNFEVKEESQERMGREWDYSFSPIKPMKVSFDGKVLHMVHESGKTYLKTDVLSYESFKSIENNEFKSETLSLEVIMNNINCRIFITCDIDLGKAFYGIEIPYVSKTHKITTYTYYM